MTRQPTEAASPAAAPGVVMAAMPLDELDRWRRGRTHPRPVAENIAMFDGYITAIVAGPVSLPPLEWICPLLGVAPDAYNDGSTPEFAAIGAVAERHNLISNTLTGTPGYAPIFGRTASGAVDVAPWCRGFHAAMQLRRKAWRPLLPTGRPATVLIQIVALQRGHDSLARRSGGCGRSRDRSSQHPRRRDRRSPMPTHRQDA